MEAIGTPPHDTPGRFMTRVQWVTEYGGIHVGKSYLSLAATLIRRLLWSPHYSVVQAVRALQGMQTTQAHALGGLKALSIPTRLDVPVFDHEGGVAIHEGCLTDCWAVFAV